MAEKQEQTKDKKEKEVKEQKPKARPEERKYDEALLRVYGYDIPASRNIYTGLTKIKGISWAISKAVCYKLNIPISKKVSELSKDEIKKIEDFLDTLDIPEYMKNRRFDEETGNTEHLYGTDLDMKKDFDIKRMKKIKSYKGVRHSSGQPVRGQRTRSHFRQRGKAVGVKKKAK